MQQPDRRRSTPELAALEGERAASEQTLAELEQLREDLSGDTQAGLAMIAQFEEKNQQLAEQVAQAERQLQDLRQGSQSQNEAIRQLNEEQLALEGQRNQAGKDAREKDDQLHAPWSGRCPSWSRRSAWPPPWRKSSFWISCGRPTSCPTRRPRPSGWSWRAMPKAQRRIAELKRAISALGSINPDAVEEFQRVNERYTYFTDQRDDVEPGQGGAGGHHRRHHPGDD